MIKETITRLTDEIADQSVELTIRHASESFEYQFHLKVGCIDEYLSVGDLKRIRSLAGSALRILKSVE